MTYVRTKKNHKVVKKHSQQRQFIILFILVCVFICLLAFYIYRLSLKKTGETSFLPTGLQQSYPTKNILPIKEISKPTPTLIISPISLPQGKTRFLGSTGDKSRTVVMPEINFDPLDVKVGEKQIIEAKITSKSKVKSVEVKIENDHKKAELVLILISGNELEGLWRGTRINEDTHKDMYNIIFIIENEQKQESYTLSFRG